MRQTIYIDIDSTIWPAEDEYSANAIRFYGQDYDMVEQYNEQFFKDTYGPDFFRIFTFNPEDVIDRELYPGVALAITELYCMGYDAHFVSHNPTPARFVMPVRLWLDQYIRVPYDLTIFGARNCKIKFMQDDPDAWGIIEDKPSTLVKARKAGYNVIARRHPWNLDEIAEYDIISFDSWFTLTDTLLELEVVCK